jgi:hypothetical protein
MHIGHNNTVCWLKMASEIIWLAINFSLDIPELTFGVLAVAFGD